MSDYFLIYLWTRLDNIVIGLVLICLGLLIYAAVIAANADATCMDKDEEHLIKNKAKKIACVSLSLFIVALFIPSSKEAAMIYTIPKLMNNDKLQESLSRVPNITNEGLKALDNLLINFNKENKE